MRDFEKISFAEFKRSVSGDELFYDSYELPKRDTKKTAGYDIYLLEDLELAPNESKKVPTGVKAYLGDDEVLLLILRSSTGFNHNVRLVNQVGVIEADYYNNKDNEGHIFLKFQNEGNAVVKFDRGSALVQGIFTKYLATNSDRRDDLEVRSDY